MFKIIKLDDISISVNNVTHNIEQFKNNGYLDDNNFSRSFAGMGNDYILDLSQRSSWNTKLPYQIHFNSVDYNNFNRNNKINYNESMYTLLKYEEGDFFKKHIDTQLNNKHAYTCLIFYNFTSFKGGDLILSDKDNNFETVIHTSNFEGIFMVIFSIDLYHEVLPVTEGKRYVFKKPLFVDYDVNTYFTEVDVLCDGGFNPFEGKGGGDY